MAGGTIGTGLRVFLTLAVPAVAHVPMATMVINMVGAFALGLLLERLSRPRDGASRTASARLLWGTGLVGGFTTYSALSWDTVDLLQRGLTAHAVGYAVGTVVMGLIAAWAGVAVAHAWQRRVEARP